MSSMIPLATFLYSRYENINISINPVFFKIYHHLSAPQRPRGDTFETRQARLSGSKKERFEKHLNHKQDEENDSLAESSKAFFDRKRQEGSLPSNATTTVL